MSDVLIDFPKVDFTHEDSRGSLNQLVHDGYKQVNVITSVKGSLRGRHYHRLNTELFYVISGKFKLIVWSGNLKEEYLMGPKSFFTIPPNVVHSFEFEEDTLLVSMYSNGVELPNGEKDIIASE